VRADVARILSEAGTTAVLVTHDQDEAFAMADHLAIIRAGHITPTAAPPDFYAFPFDPEMAAFVGDANLLHGTIDGDHATTMFGALPLRGEVLPHAASTAALVLVRPEQVEIGAAGEAGSVPGRIVHLDYHGHDVLVTIEPDDRGPDAVVVARAAGSRSFPLHGAVSIRASGSVLAWPDRAP
jgi:iron(III) transport system ATP-binding protein